MKVDFVELNSANVTADNSVDPNRGFDITAKVSVSGNKVHHIECGKVSKDNVEVSSFAKWDDGKSSYTFNGLDEEGKHSVIAEVEAFCFNIIEKIGSEPIKI